MWKKTRINRINSYFTPHTHVYIHHRLQKLNVKGKTIELLEDNKEEYLYDIRDFQKAFLNLRHKKY